MTYPLGDYITLPTRVTVGCSLLVTRCVCFLEVQRSVQRYPLLGSCDRIGSVHGPVVVQVNSTTRGRGRRCGSRPGSPIKMSSEQRDDTSIITDNSTPTDAQGDPLKWDGNRAKIKGLLKEFGLWTVRKGLLQALFKHRAALLSNGKVAVSSIQAVSFVQGAITDSDVAGAVIEYSFDNICPPIAERVARAARRQPPGRVAPLCRYPPPAHAVVRRDPLVQLRAMHSLLCEVYPTDRSGIHG